MFPSQPPFPSPSPSPPAVLPPFPLYPQGTGSPGSATAPSAMWTKEENWVFEAALVEFSEENEGMWEKIALQIPGKTPHDVEEHYRRLERDLLDIEAGIIKLPAYTDGWCGCGVARQAHTADAAVEHAGGGVHKEGRTKARAEERKKGIPWTDEEHRRFVKGLEEFGKGDWRSISRNCVKTKTASQVASHAQKYFLRQSAAGQKARRRSSIHDITRP